MAKYYVQVPAEASGHQRFLVEAESADAAAQKWIENGGEFVDEELEITSLANDVAWLTVEEAEDQEPAAQRVALTPESPYIAEQREVLRRIAERGLRYAQDGGVSVDLWQHMLDELARFSSVSRTVEEADTECYQLQAVPRHDPTKGADAP